MFKLCFFIFMLLANGKTESGDMDLLKLKSNWNGNGIAVIYPGAMKLLTQKINQQAGVLSTITQIPAGESWELEVSLKILCEGEASDLGVGLWLTFNDPKMSSLDYNFETVAGTYGMIPSIDGLGLVYTNRSLFTSLMRSERVSRSDLIYRSKSCKIYIQDNQNIKFKVKYRSKVLGVYALEHKEKIETMCMQYTEVENFHNFYVSASASTQLGKCTIDINKMLVKQPQNLFQLVDEKDKKEGDPFFAYFSDLQKTKSVKRWEAYNTMFQQYRESSILLAKELLEFADTNQKELTNKITRDLKTQIEKVSKAIEVIGMEAQQIESLSDFIEQDKKQINSSVDDLSDQIIEWLNQMEESYASVDEETKRIYDTLNDININDKINTIISKSESVVEALNSLLFKARDFTNDNPLNQLKTDDIEYWDDRLKDVKNQINDEVKRSTSKNASSLKSIAYGFLITVAGLIFLAFGFMYWKIQKAIRLKRIL